MKKENKRIEGMDERQNQILQKAIVCGYIFLIICLLIATVYRIATTGDAGWELFGIIGASIVIIVARRIMGDIEQPLDYKNRPLPTGSSKSDKMTRCKNYAVDSAIVGLVFSVMDILFLIFGKNDVSDYELAQIIFPNLSKEATIAVTAILSFIIMFLVSFLFEYLIGEFYKVKRYNKMLAQLDSEENNQSKE